MVSLSVQQIDAWHRNHLLMTFWYSNVIRGDTVICGLKIVVSWSKSSKTPRQWWRSRSMPRISPRGRRRFSGFNHRFLKTFFFRGQTNKSLFRFTTFNVIIDYKVTSLNLYFMSNSSFPWSSLCFGNYKYTQLSGPCTATWSRLKYLINNWMWLPWILDF